MDKHAMGLMSVETIRLPDDPVERTKMRLVSMFITAYSMGRMKKFDAVPGGILEKFGDFFAGQIGALAHDLNIDDDEFKRLACEQFKASVENASKAIAQDLAASMPPQGGDPS